MDLYIYIYIYIYDLKHPRSPTTGNWLDYTVFNTIYWCLLYLKVWSDCSGVHCVGMTTCTWGKLVSTTELEQDGHFQFDVIKLFSLGIDYISREKAGLCWLAGLTRITNIFSRPQKKIWIKLRILFHLN